jgi:hypothetical protein
MVELGRAGGSMNWSELGYDAPIRLARGRLASPDPALGAWHFRPTHMTRSIEKSS